MRLRFSTASLSNGVRAGPFLAVIAACTGPTSPALEPSPLAAQLPRPMLGPTAPFAAALEAADPARERLAASGTALAGRAEALQARAGNLQGPVVDPDLRQRLLRAGG